MEFGNKELNWLIFLGILGSTIAFLVFLRRWLKPTPYPEGNFLEEIDDQGQFLPNTVKQGHIYSIWCDDQRQEFVVLTILDVSSWMHIGVYPPNDQRTGRKRKFAFKGWTQAVCHRSFIEVHHLADSPMGSAAQDHHLRRLAEIGFN